MVDLDKMLELLEEKRQLLLAFEAVTQGMLTCPEEQLKGRQRLLERLRELETELAELCSRAGEDGALARAAAQAKAEPSALPEELGPVYRAAMEAQAVLSRLPESEVQAIMRLRLEQERILEQIKSTNQGSAAKAARFYSVGAGQGGSSRLGHA